jgi:hypothetical protein
LRNRLQGRERLARYLRFLQRVLLREDYVEHYVEMLIITIMAVLVFLAFSPEYIRFGPIEIWKPTIPYPRGMEVPIIIFYIIAMLLIFFVSRYDMLKRSAQS